MFFKCKSLKKINVKSFDIRNVTTMKYMFGYCKNLTDLDLSNFENEKVKDISFMFSNCEILENLNFSKFKVKNANITSTFLKINPNCKKQLADSMLK